MYTKIQFQCDAKHSFTCWSGQCIPLYKRCNELLDCEDESDEYECNQVKIDASRYRGNIPPKNSSKKSLSFIEVSFEVKHIVEVDVPEVSIYY